MIRNLTWILETSFVVIKWGLKACRSDLEWFWHPIQFSVQNHLRTVLRSAPKPSFLWKIKPNSIVICRSICPFCAALYALGFWGIESIPFRVARLWRTLWLYYLRFLYFDHIFSKIRFVSKNTCIFLLVYRIIFDNLVYEENMTEI